MRIIVWLAGVCLLPGLVMAQSGAVVEGLQQPTWVERGKLRTGLYPGYALQGGDRVVTGKTGKLVLRLAEGSQVKLGVNMDLHIDKLESRSKGVDDVVEGFLRVVTGAIRFTTPAAAKKRDRDFRIGIGAATIGIRGTDVWGKAADDKDFVVLLEGDIQVEREGEVAIRMSTPLTIFDAPKGAPAKAVEPVDTVKLQQWALETELDQKQGALTQDGLYVVYLMSTVQRRYADEQQEYFQELGYAAQVYEKPKSSKPGYRVGVAGFVSLDDARWFVDQAKTQLGIQDAWIGKKSVQH